LGGASRFRETKTINVVSSWLAGDEQARLGMPATGVALHMVNVFRLTIAAGSKSNIARIED
jgi:hypothetical protein